MSENDIEHVARNFTVEGIDQRLLYGQNDLFLRIIETSFESKIVARGEKITIEGASGQVENVVQLLDDLVERIKQGDFISQQYLNYAISMVKETGKG